MIVLLAIVLVFTFALISFRTLTEPNWRHEISLRGSATFSSEDDRFILESRIPSDASCEVRLLRSRFFGLSSLEEWNFTYSCGYAATDVLFLWNPISRELDSVLVLHDLAMRHFSGQTVILLVGSGGKILLKASLDDVLSFGDLASATQIHGIDWLRSAAVVEEGTTVRLAVVCRCSEDQEGLRTIKIDYSTGDLLAGSCTC
ncbi:MAG: hypothetical protein GY722_26530 [bacterium]|nr:hypothetical protein [bacterium]